MVKQVDALTHEQHAQIAVYERKRIANCLRIGATDHATFEAAARRCYEYAEIPWHGNVVWVSSPVGALVAAMLAGLLRKWRGRGRHEPPEVSEAMDQTLEGLPPTIGREVRAAVLEALAGAPSEPSTAGFRSAYSRIWVAVCGVQLDHHLGHVVHQALRSRSGVEVHWAVRAAVLRAAEYLGSCTEHDDVIHAIRNICHDDMGGQLDTRRGMRTRYIREVLGLELAGDLWRRAIANEQIQESGCWWFPHSDFLVVSGLPQELHTEIAGGLPRLHRTDGPAIVWPDGWRLYSVHGRELPQWIIERPEALTVASIESEPNAEVRRIMLERYGPARYITDCVAQIVDAMPLDHPVAGLRGARLLRKVLSGEPEPLVFLEMVNSTPEPDGSCRRYLQRIDPNAYNGDAGRYCHAAMASLWRHRDDTGVLRRTFENWRDYIPATES
jgi:hypothetical protein